MRYFYYLVVVTMLMNTVLFAPRTLYEERFDGAILSIMLAPIISSLMMYMFIYGMKKYPGKALPQILIQGFHPFFGRVILLIIGLMSFSAGCLIIVAFTALLRKYLMPDRMSVMYTLSLFLILVIYASSKRFKSILYASEIVLILSIPIIFIIFFVVIKDENLEWLSVQTMSNYSFHPPSFIAISAATYVFSGFFTISIYNREYPADKIKYLWTVPLAGFILLIFTFIVPIGYFGTVGVGQIVFAWVSAIDSVRFHYGFMERTIFIYLLMYVNVTFVLVITSWHIAKEILVPVFEKSKRVKNEDNNVLQWIILSCFVIITLLYAHYVVEREQFIIVKSWLQIRFIVEICLVIIIFVLGVRRRKRENS